MQKRTVIDSIEIIRDGTIQARLAKEVVDADGTVLSQQWHRVRIAPGGDIDAQFAAVNQHLVKGLNYPAVDPEGVTGRLKPVAATVWTEKVLSDYLANQRARADRVNSGAS